MSGGGGAGAPPPLFLSGARLSPRVTIGRITLRDGVVPALKGRGFGLVDNIIAGVVEGTKPLPLTDVTDEQAGRVAWF